MAHSERVTDFIAKQRQWKEELETLRALFQKTELVEDFKWSSPTYTLNGKIVAGYVGFKNHYAIWFHQGVFLKDPQKKLVNAQEGKTQAMRQWRFEKGDAIPEALVLDYLQESIENCLAGKQVTVQRNKPVVIPPLLKDAFTKDPTLAAAFQNLTLGKQRDYAEYISTAKQEATQLKRLEKITPMILSGIGLNDQYKKG
ncbi:MAG: YdeI/OmpD-associated family protein [Flavobacteriaceae bacterium]